MPNLNISILAISGSLRSSSSNTVLLRVASRVAPENMQVKLYEGIGDLPHFNPDLDGETPPASVADFRARLKAADAVMICSPEYAHGVPGSLKNALDWIVGSGEFISKPIALINAKPQSTYAHDSLAETLTVMMGKIVPEASLPISLGSNKVDEEILMLNRVVTDALRSSMIELKQFIELSQDLATKDSE